MTNQPTKEGLLQLLNILKKTDLYNDMLESNENDLFEIWKNKTEAQWVRRHGDAGIDIYNYLHPITKTRVIEEKQSVKKPRQDPHSSTLDPSSKPAFIRGKSDQEFIDLNNLNLEKPQDSHQFLLHHFYKLVSQDVLKAARECTFKDNCLEYRLDRRLSTYSLDGKNYLKILLAVSGAGKTRLLLELLHQEFGYYFVVDSSQTDFGSRDLLACSNQCESNPDNTYKDLDILYFIRITICNHLVSIGFNLPSQILLAQLHPIAFFGLDVFESLFHTFKEYYGHVKAYNAFTFCAIDEIQLSLESRNVYKLPYNPNRRPFFSPLVYYTKDKNIFTNFVLSGTGINFEYLTKSMSSAAMKTVNSMYEIISEFDIMSIEQIKSYSTTCLREHGITNVDEIVSRIEAFELCHGRARFVAFLLDNYLETRDIDESIGRFILGLSNTGCEIFPLKFLYRDIQNSSDGLERIVGTGSNARTLGSSISDAMLDYLINGCARIYVQGNDAAKCIRYGLGGGVPEGSDTGFFCIQIQELAVIECLRHLIPFRDLVLNFVKQISTCLNPRIAGYMIEYLVAFTLVANVAGEEALKIIKAFHGGGPEYIGFTHEGQVYFPDHMCGPDIIYKCNKTRTIYIVQVKFVKGICKQQRVNALETTDPNHFYCKRGTSEIINGFEKTKRRLAEQLDFVVSLDSFKIQRMLFIHSNQQNTQTHDIQNVEIITRETSPQFFDAIHTEMWDYLDTIRANFEYK